MPKSTERKIKMGEEIIILHYETANNDTKYLVMYQKDNKIGTTILKTDEVVDPIETGLFIQTKKGLVRKIK